MTTSYTASSIVILTPDETNARFGWLRVQGLAAEYRKPVAWIQRGLEACRRAGIDDDYFIARYLKRQDIPRNEAADLAMRDIVRGDR
jgi:hypothetical protein